MKRALITGAGGFIGGHLVTRLKKEGYHVTGADLHLHSYVKSQADKFLTCDLRDPKHCRRVIGDYDEVYQLAADHGGIGHIIKNEQYVMANNTAINHAVIEQCVLAEIPRLFFSSSVCVYRNMEAGENEMTESHAYPAYPDSEYGWEKLYAERYLLTQARHSNMQVRIARFKTVYGPYCTFEGGREKVVPALCKKVAETDDGGIVEVWGDGTALRCFTYVDDLIDGIRILMKSDVDEPLNLGNSRRWMINELVMLIAKVAQKDIRIYNNLDKPVGVLARNFSTKQIEALGWRPKFRLEEGLRRTYSWIDAQVQKGRGTC